MRSRRFGVEIEFAGLKLQVADLILRSYFDGDRDHMGRVWSVQPETSVPDGFELVTPPITYDDLPLLEDLSRRFIGSGARSSLGAGIHVHVEVSDFSLPQLRSLIGTYSSHAELIARMVDAHPARRLLYCLPIKAFAEAVECSDPLSIEQLRDIWYESMQTSGFPVSRHDLSRFSELNLNSYFYRGTAEFRLFNATENIASMRTYVVLALAITQYAWSHPELRPLREVDIRDEPRARREVDEFLDLISLGESNFGFARKVLTEGVDQYYGRRRLQHASGNIRFEILGRAFNGLSYARILDRVADSRLLDEPEIRSLLNLYRSKRKWTWGDEDEKKLVWPKGSLFGTTSETFAKAAIEALAGIHLASLATDAG